MFDMSWGELLVISGVALVVIGPKDLPKALRTVGNIAGKVRRLAGEFQTQFNEAMREADLEELRKAATDVSDAVAPFKSQFDPFKAAGSQLQQAIEAPTAPASPAIAAETPAAGRKTPKEKAGPPTREQAVTQSTKPPAKPQARSRTTSAAASVTVKPDRKGAAAAKPKGVAGKEKKPVAASAAGKPPRSDGKQAAVRKQPGEAKR